MLYAAKAAGKGNSMDWAAGKTRAGTTEAWMVRYGDRGRRFEHSISHSNRPTFGRRKAILCETSPSSPASEKALYQRSIT